MKASLPLLLFLLLPIAVRAQSTPSASPRASSRGAGMPRTMYVTFDRAPMYDSATYLSTILATLQRGDSVVVTGRSGTFLEVVHGERRGYVLAANLGTAPPKGAAPRKARATEATPEAGSTTTGTSGASTSTTTGTATSSTPSAATSGSTGSGGKKEEAATVQCRAITKSGKQCSRRTSDPSGYCWQHKK